MKAICGLFLILIFGWLIWGLVDIVELILIISPCRSGLMTATMVWGTGWELFRNILFIIRIISVVLFLGYLVGSWSEKKTEKGGV